MEKLLSYLKLANDNRQEMDDNIYKWYAKCYPNDEEAEYMNKEISFYDLFAAMCIYNENEDIYRNMIINDDSVLRERIFKKITEILNVKYELIYQLWLGNVFNNVEKSISIMFTYLNKLTKINNITENEAMILAKQEFNHNALTITKILMFGNNQDISFADINNEYDSIIIGNYLGIIIYG